MDVRVLERNLDRGLITSKDHEKTVKDLPDDAANALWTNLEELAEND